MCTWGCARSAPSVEPAEAALSATFLARSAPAKGRPPTQFFSRCTSIVNSSKLTARRAVRADRLFSARLHRRPFVASLLRVTTKGRHNSSAVQPRALFSARLRDAQRRAKRGAEAPGQQTSVRRLLARVGPPMHLAFVQNRATRTIVTDSVPRAGGENVPKLTEGGSTTRPK